MFRTIDTDGSGEIELSEIIEAPLELKEALSSIVHFDSVDELFRILDFDQSGAIGIDEFLDGVMRAQGDKPIELHCLMKQCAEILREVREVTGSLTGRPSCRKSSPPFAQAGGSVILT